MYKSKANLDRKRIDIMRNYTMLNKTRICLVLLIVVFSACEEDSEPSFNAQLNTSEIEALFDKNDLITGDGILKLDGEEIQMSYWSIGKINYYLNGETGVGLSIYATRGDDDFTFFSKPIINKSGSYSFEELTGRSSIYLDLGTSPKCTDYYFNDSGTITIDFKRSNIEVTIDYLGDYITEEPYLGDSCLQTFISADSHPVEVEISFPLYERHFN